MAQQSVKKENWIQTSFYHQRVLTDTFGFLSQSVNQPFHLVDLLSGTQCPLSTGVSMYRTP